MALKVKRTERNDWLSQALVEHPRTFVSGSERCSERFIPHGLVGFRAMAHFPSEHPPPTGHRRQGLT